MVVGQLIIILVFGVHSKILFRALLVFVDLLILSSYGDADSMAELSRKVGLQAKDLRYIFDNICTDFHDSLIIDKSRPYAKLRKNIFEVIPYNKR